MSRKYKFSDNDQLYFITFTVVGWLDIFIRKEYKDILLDSWRFCQKEKELIWAQIRGQIRLRQYIDKLSE